MKKTRIVGIAILLAAMLIQTGCVWEGYGSNRGDDRHERDRGDQHERNHGDHDGDRGGEHGGDHGGDH
jgi:hypothetical protein